jgi:replicative DNA helicase
MPTSRSKVVEQTERALLGSVLLDNSPWPQTNSVSADDFCLESHRRIFRCMAAMAEDQRAIDEVTLPQELAIRSELESIGGFAYIGALLDGTVPENVAEYVKLVRQASAERRVSRQVELMAKTCEMQASGKLNNLREQFQQAIDSLDASSAGNDWKSLFHTHEEIIHALAASFAIDGFLQQEGITLIGGLAGHGKTWVMLAMCRALLEGGRLFHHFAVRARPAGFLPDSRGWIGPFLCPAENLPLGSIQP